MRIIFFIYSLSKTAICVRTLPGPLDKSIIITHNKDNLLLFNNLKKGKDNESDN